VLVAVSRGGSPALELPRARLGNARPEVLYGDARADCGEAPADDDTLTVPACADAAAYVWRLGQPSDSSV
jgi:hypothetical protein